ncbi:MAG: MBL fold metallo-hydrolase [Flavobacteriales bacterium]|nr:MBL fold metallo-hydrolase [Flavobacteriales bacterium]
MSSDKLIVNFLGTGTSQGVPVIGCHCDVCSSTTSENNRLRSSIHISKKNTSIVIDTGPDFRQQMLNYKIEKLDAVLFTHEHKDHVAGLDDVRAYNFLQKKPIDIFCSDHVFECLKREYRYIFDHNFKYPGIPKVNRFSLENKTFSYKDLKIQPIQVMHYKLPVFGFRIDKFCYITDASFIEKKEKEKLKNLDVLVINALRKEKHISHFNLEEALNLIKELNPKEAYLTHISHLLGSHEAISKELPNNVFLSHDKLSLTL